MNTFCHTVCFIFVQLNRILRDSRHSHNVTCRAGARWLEAHPNLDFRARNIQDIAFNTYLFNKCLYVASTASKQHIKQNRLHLLYFKLEKRLFATFQRCKYFVNSVISDDFVVSLSVDITARFVNYSSVIFDL